eukprot:gene6303-10309_t
MNKATKIAKVYLPNNEIRKFSTQDKTFDEFKTTVLEGGLETFEMSSITLQYQDDEDEWVTFSSELEWIHALSHQLSTILRIRVVLPKNGKFPRVIPVQRSLKCCSMSYAQYTQNLPADLFEFQV